MKKIKYLVILGVAFSALSVVAFVLPKIEKAAKEAPHPLAGIKAPDVDLTMLDGSTIKLSEHEGKEVVVLDFWASWCGPCRSGLPVLNRVGSNFADTNVVFYAVNLREEASEAQGAAEELGLSLPIALDLSGEVAGSFGVAGIPHTVVIDLEGRIWTTHVGFSSTMEAQLTADLKAVLAGADPQVVTAAVPVVEAYVAKPLPSEAEAILWTDLEQPYANVLERELLLALKEYPVKGDVPEEDLIIFISYLVQLECGQMTAKNRSLDYQPDLGLYKKMSQELSIWFEMGVDHPVLRYADVLSNRALNKKDQRLKSAEVGLKLCHEAGTHAPWIEFEFLEELSRFSEPASTRKKWRKQARRSFVTALHEDLYESGEERVMSFRLAAKYTDFFWESEWRSVADALLADGQVSLFLQQLADGWAHVKEAWDVRGNGWGSKVSKEGWLGFNEHLDAARAALTASWGAHPELPEAPRKMITVSMGRSIEHNEERKWFDRAVAAQFDYASAYDALIWAICPRWGGSIAALQSFSDECIDTDRYDTKVPFLYFIGARNIMVEADFNPANFQRPDEQLKLLRIIDNYRVDGSFDESTMASAVSFAAAAAVLGGNHEMAYELLQSIDFKTSGYFNTSKMGVKSWEDYKVSSVLRGGPVAGDYKALLELRDAGRFEAAIQLCTQLQDSSSLTDLAQERLQIERAALVADKTMAGEWCSIFGRGDDISWAGRNYLWKIDGAGRLQGTKKQGIGWLPGRLSLVDGFEIEFMVDRVKKSPVKSERAVFFLCRPEWHQYFPVNVKFKFKENQIEVDRGYNDDEKTVPCLFQQSNQIRIVVQDKKMSVWVNGQEAVHECEMPSTGRYADSLWYGLGDYYSGRFKDKIRFHSIRLKRPAS